MTDGIKITANYPGALPSEPYGIPVAFTAEQAAQLFRDGKPGLRVMCGDLVNGRHKLCHFDYEAVEFYAAI